MVKQMFVEEDPAFKRVVLDPDCINKMGMKLSHPSLHGGEATYHGAS